VPDYDVLVTNPPFSGTHLGRILRFCAASGKPWMLLVRRRSSPRSDRAVNTREPFTARTPNVRAAGYDACGVFGTTLAENIGVSHSSVLKQVPITPNAS
jgi:hypothetical protein